MFRSISLNPFSKDDSNFLKGFAILIIALHNYYRAVNPTTGENEFWFSDFYIQKFYIILGSNPLELFKVVFNFLGHYGVQAFIFISAYGLTLSYNEKQPKFKKFILHRFDKLYPSFFLVAILYILIVIFTSGKFIDNESLANLGIQLSLFANFIPGKALAINGPWWFYSLIFQFYLIFPLLMWVLKKYNTKGLVLIAIIGFVSTIFLYKPMSNIELNPLYLFIGHLPEFCFGILLATRKNLKMPVWVIILAVLLLIGGNTYKWMWPIANISAAILLVSLIQFLLHFKNKLGIVFSASVFVGSISMYIFACHGILRINFINLANYLSSPFASFSIAILFIIVSIAIAYMLMQIEQFARTWITFPQSKSSKFLRLIFLLTIVLGSIGILYFQNQKIPSVNTDIKSEIKYSLKNDFEAFNKQESNKFDTIHYSGQYSMILPAIESYTPVLEISFDTIDLNGIFEAEASAMLYTTDSLAEGNLVFEVCHIKSGKIMEWKSNSIPKEEFQEGKWQQIKYNFRIPNFYQFPKYKIRTYMWNNSKGVFYADDLKLEIKAR